MSKRFSLVVFAACGIAMTFAQPTHYSSQNIHAHNDYEKPVPFWTAFHAGAGSVEADVFLVDGTLVLAHSIDQVIKEKTLEAVYLKPLDSLINAGHGALSKRKDYHLQLMIDLKSPATPTLDSLVALLERHPRLIAARQLSVTISGNRPMPESYGKYPAFIWFDGLPDHQYAAAELDRIPMFSDNFRNYSHWNGSGMIPAKDIEQLRSTIVSVHKLGKTIRFWNAPDDKSAWQELVKLNVDWINTDKVLDAAAYLNGPK